MGENPMFRLLTTHALALGAFALWPTIACAQTRPIQQIDNLQILAGSVTVRLPKVDQGHCPTGGSTQHRTQKFTVEFKPPFGGTPTVMTSITRFNGVDHGRNFNLD